jgi:FemAB-related protein (PEP-CTERM system-associated)
VPEWHGGIAAEDPGLLTVEELRDAGDAWDQFVGDSEGATFCHLSAWREILYDALGHDSHYLIARDEAGAWEGVLPLVRVRSRIFGDYLLSMPFLNDGGPLGNGVAQARLAAHALEMARRFNVKLLELRMRAAQPTALTPVRRKVTVMMPLPATADALMSMFPSKLRSQIRRPLREGMRVAFGAEQRAPFYEVFARNMRDLGTPVLPRRFFDAIAAQLPAEVTFGCVYYGDQPVAAGCGFLYNGEFEITWASSLREHNQRAPNMLLYWSMMQHVIEHGARVWNFGRCTPGGGTHRFKLQWGGSTLELPWQHWSRPGASGPPTADGGVFELATRVWSRLPLPIANHVGPLLSRGLP